MLRCYEPAHIVGVSKTAYVLATPRCLQWRRDLQPTSTNNDPVGSGFAGSASPACSSLSRRSPQPSARSRRRPRPRRRTTIHVLDVAPVARERRRRRRGALGEADGAVPDGTTVFDDEIPGVAKLDPLCSAPCAEQPLMLRTTGSSSSSIVAGVPRSTRSNSSVRRSRSTAQKRKPPDGWPPPERLLTCRGTRSTSGPPVPRRGCPSTAPRTGCARSTATSPGTTNCARRPSLTVALAMYADPTHDPRMQP